MGKVESLMVGRQKILLMTKLALYDKHEGASDRAANDYFRHDLIYRKNLGTRLAVGLGGLIILAFYWLRMIFIDGADVFEMYFQTYITNSVLFLLALLAFYTLIGTIKGTREYFLVQKRLEKYDRHLKHLERIEERGKKRNEVEKNLESLEEKVAERPRARRAASRTVAAIPTGADAPRRRQTARAGTSTRQRGARAQPERPKFTMDQGGDTKPRPNIRRDESALIRRQDPDSD